jgi:hypothetical protein
VVDEAVPILSGVVGAYVLVAVNMVWAAKPIDVPVGIVACHSNSSHWTFVCAGQLATNWRVYVLVL